MQSDWERFVEAVSVEFGERLKAAREHSNVKQSDLANKLGLQRTSISNMENGHQIPSLPQVIAMAQALGVPLSDLAPNVRAPIENTVIVTDKIAAYYRVRDRVVGRLNAQ